MPSDVIAAAPTDVLPLLVTAGLNETLRIEALVNVYVDGSSDRGPLQINPRKFFRCTVRLTPDGVGAATWTALWNFYRLHIGTPFYFYLLRETTPPFTYDATGQATAGRYTVVFDGPYAETGFLGSCQASFGMREIL
jgi:hypothetical protein